MDLYKFSQVAILLALALFIIFLFPTTNRTTGRNKRLHTSLTFVVEGARDYHTEES